MAWWRNGCWTAGEEWEECLEGGAFYTHHEYTDCTGQYSRQPDYRLVADQPVSSAGFRCCSSESPPSEEDIAADANARIESARKLNSTVIYQADNELEISPGLFMDRFEYPNIAGEYPIRAINWSDANARCTSAGKRLCSASEWELACGGAKRNALPYGEQYVAGACPVYLDAPTPSGSHPACTSELGVYDLVGGLWEWTSTTLDAEALRAQGLSFGDQSYWHKDPDSMGTQSQSESLREIRGGSWYVEEKKAFANPMKDTQQRPREPRSQMLDFVAAGDKLKPYLKPHQNRANPAHLASFYPEKCV